MNIVTALLGMLLLCETASAVAPYPCYRSAKPKFLDGKLNDWQYEPVISIDGWYWRAQAGKKSVYGGMYDLWGAIRFAWDEKNLYLAASVLDDTFFPAKTGQPDSGDAIIVTIVPGELDPASKTSQRQFLFTLNTETTTYLHCSPESWIATNDIYLGAARNILASTTTPIPHEPEKQPAKRLSKLFYEIAIPWKQLPGITPGPNTSMGIAVQILDNDGNGIRGSLNWHGGRDITMSPANFALVNLENSKIK
ncbi:MAG TPA: sugar-binding protein [Armatimonadota bacterium]|nr:sugar-binding protein [Armatimonadota bacterium]